MKAERPFSTTDWFAASPSRAVFAPAGRLLDRALGLATLQRLYQQRPPGEGHFCDAALDVLRIGCDVADDELRNLPRTGPLVIVANHPLGGLDGLLVASIVGRVRPDLKLLGNHLLARIPELAGSLIAVDPYGGDAAIRRNRMALRGAIRWIDDGGALALFPAGEVAVSRGPDGSIVDPEWSPGAARLILASGAAVVPMFIEGAASLLFRLAGRVHPRLRTALLPRELLGQRGRRVRVRIGSPVPGARLAKLSDPERAAFYLRVRTYALGGVPRQPRHVQTHHESTTVAMTPVADAEPAELLRREISYLPNSRALLRSGEFVVFVAGADEIPRALCEIGRLRELAFRATGEGTGAPRDIDGFDRQYDHLFVWNELRAEVVGAYRMGRTDEILARCGIDGLYTRSLFRYGRRLLDEIGPALELGRAFVRLEYQRDYSPLLLLWKGIGRFVVTHPRYRTLFGPVSISSEYHSISQQILAAFLYATSYRADLGALIAPRNPPDFQRRRGWSPAVSMVARTLAEAGALLSEIEGDRKGVPVLLRQYLKLNAKLLGFNVDASFGNALDGLMLVDLLDVDREILDRYMGKAAAMAFLSHHAGADARRAS